MFLFLFGAVFTDLYKDKIYNLWIVPGILMGLILQLSRGTDNFLNALLAMGASILILMPVYLIKGIAAGDVKLFLMTASFLSVQDIFSCILFSFLIAGAISLIVVLIKRNRHATIHFAVPVMASALITIGGVL
jgi:prepilin peptidase CpaA